MLVFQFSFIEIYLLSPCTHTHTHTRTAQMIERKSKKTQLIPSRVECNGISYLYLTSSWVYDVCCCLLPGLIMNRHSLSLCVLYLSISQDTDETLWFKRNNFNVFSSSLPSTPHLPSKYKITKPNNFWKKNGLWSKT